MIGIGLFAATCLVALGIAIGMYIASQISEHIDCRTRRKKFMYDLENFDKPKNKKK